MAKAKIHDTPPANNEDWKTHRENGNKFTTPPVVGMGLNLHGRIPSYWWERTHETTSPPCLKTKRARETNETTFARTNQAQ
jgi:hypothetical protein